MNTSSDAAEQIVRLSLEGFEVAAKVTGSGAKDVAALLYAIMKDKKKTSGKTSLNNMLKSGKELRVFSVRKIDFEKFSEEAKRYGVLYNALINKKNNDGIVDILVRAEDAAKINRIVDRFKLISYDKASIISNTDKTKEEKEKGIITKDMEQDTKSAPIKKEENFLNPHLAKTEKSPRSKLSLEMQKTSDQGTKINEKPSVKEKLKKAKEEVKVREKSKVISEVSKLNKNVKEIKR